MDGSPDLTEMEAGGQKSVPPTPSFAADGVTPSAEQLEAEALRRGMQPLVMCLRRCPHCLEGVPIRSRMCSYCHFMIPPSAKAAARKEAQEAANQAGKPIGSSTSLVPATHTAVAAASIESSTSGTGGRG
ncbi:unnamed protein product, partial [Choristocarpus tenellus]